MKIDGKSGFSLVEILIVILILSIMISVMYLSLSAGRDSWNTTNTQIQLQESLRLTIQRISTELRESGKDENGISQVAIANNTGFNNSDVLTFSIPIFCSSTASIIDSNGNVANWGAALTWGCHNSTCMDADDSCLSIDYSSISYLIDSNNQLLRRVLNGVGATVREDIFAQNITDFQASINVAETMVTLTITAMKTSDGNRQISENNTINVYLRNRG